MRSENNSSNIISRLFVSGLAVLASATGAASARPEPFYRIGGHLDLWEHPQGRPDAGEAVALSIPEHRNGPHGYLSAMQKPNHARQHAGIQAAHDAQAGTATKQHLRGK